MCLRVNKEFKNKKEALEYFEKPLITKTDIKVYKLLERLTYEKSKIIGGVSPFAYYRYERGFQYTESDFSRKINGLFELEIEQGLHAYVDKNTALKEKKDSKIWDWHFHIIEMWIPRGAKYFIGTHNDIVTNKLIWY